MIDGPADFETLMSSLRRQILALHGGTGDRYSEKAKNNRMVFTGDVSTD